MFLLPKYDSQGKETGFQSSKPLNSSASANDALMSFDDFYRQSTGYNVNPYGLFGRIDNFFSGRSSSAKQAYENYLADYEYQRNLKAPQNDVQKAVADIKAAGLNPWLALNGGSMSSAVTASQSASARYEVRDKHIKSDKSGKSVSLLGTALKIIMMAALMS